MKAPWTRSEADARKASEGARHRPSDRSRQALVALQYFLYFGVFAVYLPYFNLYCYHLGFSGPQIGILSALRSVALVVFGLMWGALADRFQSRRGIFILCSMAATAVWSAYLTTERFAPMLIITVAHALFFAPLISFLEAFSMDVLGARKQRYGRLRLWGSIGFILVVLAMGRLLENRPVNLIVPLILVGSGVQGVFALALPRPAGQPVRPLWQGAEAMRRLRLWLFLGGAFLMLVSHGTYYGFFSIHLEMAGFGKSFIGLAWALASAAEIGVMVGSEALFRRFSLPAVLVFSTAVAVLRWVLVWIAVSPAAILATQVLHAVTYGTFHMASILFVDRLMPEAAKTSGQALNNAVTYGLGNMAGFFLNGYLFEIMGTRPLFLVSAGIALAGGLLLAAALGFQLSDPKSQI
ncbi:MAG: MFS transporter [Desulfobacteraceae bacterium]|nr:MFS transporter [Desulfobacteraceae bacterium]